LRPPARCWWRDDADVWGLRDSVVYFVAPSELSERAQPGQRVRLGGLVVEGTVRRDEDGAMRFAVTDGARTS
jgi:cytochrome c-type biogenesis protein CcmE